MHYKQFTYILVSQGNFTVNCGDHKSNACSKCPQGRGARWCNGECTWDYSNKVCIKQGKQMICIELIYGLN